MKILDKFHSKITSKAHSILAFSILPLPWMDESTGLKLPGRFLDFVIADKCLRELYISTLKESSVLGVRNREDNLSPTSRPLLKRSRTEELSVFRAVSGDDEATYESSVTRDVASIYSHLNQERLYVYIVS